MNITRSIITAAMIAATSAAATETEKVPSQAEITDMVLNELNQRASKDRADRVEASAAAGYVKDAMSVPAKDRTAGTDIVIEYDKGIDRNKSAGFIQAISDAVSFIGSIFK